MVVAVGIVVYGGMLLVCKTHPSTMLGTKQAFGRIKHRTSNVEHRTPNEVFAALRHFINWQHALLDVGR
jgi:hypothetical protein